MAMTKEEFEQGAGDFADEFNADAEQPPAPVEDSTPEPVDAPSETDKMDDDATLSREAAKAEYEAAHAELPDPITEPEKPATPNKPQSFGEAFKAGRKAALAGGSKTFEWTNPKTGKTITYGTDLEGEKKPAKQSAKPVAPKVTPQEFAKQAFGKDVKPVTTTPERIASAKAFAKGNDTTTDINDLPATAKGPAKTNSHAPVKPIGTANMGVEGFASKLAAKK